MHAACNCNVCPVLLMMVSSAMQVAAVGFCMGGALAVAASQYRKICAAVACYGLPPANLCMVSNAFEVSTTALLCSTKATASQRAIYCLNSL